MRRITASVVYVSIAAGIGFGQVAMHIIEITLPRDVPSDTVSIRYVVEGDDFGAWVQSRKGVSSYSIAAIRGGHAARIRGIVYAPGCALQTFDILPGSSNYEQFPFFCQPLKAQQLSATVAHMDRLYGRDITLQVKYVARWAQRFLGIDEVALTSIPIGDPMDLPRDGKFQLALPDFTDDPIAGAPDHEGEINVWAHDKSTGELVALLVPTVPASLRVHVGGLKIQRTYPPDLTFAPCASGNARVYDAIGFARRSDIRDACE